MASGMRAGLRPGRRLLPGLILATLVTTGAQAGLEICNDTGVRQSVAIGYKGETDWTSEGWWNIDPGNCATLVAGDLTKRYYYYYAESSRSFEGQNFTFCTHADVFTIIGDTECEQRGYKLQGFREIDTGETATEFTLTMPETDAPDSGAETGETAAISATGSGPGGGPQAQGGETGTVEDTRLTDLNSGIEAGAHGTPFALDALFQGCELEDGRAYCGFHAEGRKLRVFYDGPTPNEMLYALEEMPVNTPVRLEGDRVGARSLQTAVVLRALIPRPGSDPDAVLRAAMQGDWVSEQDKRIGFTIRGSELYTRFDGEFRGARFMYLAESCDEARGVGPVLVQTKLKDGSSSCFVVERVEGGVMELTDPGRGVRLRYVSDG